jgi:hypothetical protein
MNTTALDAFRHVNAMGAKVLSKVAIHKRRRSCLIPWLFFWY